MKASMNIFPLSLAEARQVIRSAGARTTTRAIPFHSSPCALVQPNVQTGKGAGSVSYHRGAELKQSHRAQAAVGRADRDGQGRRLD
jgi:hypothetical protein